MNRRSFLTNATRLVATGAALAVAANAPHLLTQAQPTTPPPAAAPAAAPAATKHQQRQPRQFNKPLPKYASHSSIRSAGIWALMNWWGNYGAGVQAHLHRGVPRTYVRQWLYYHWGIIAEEHLYG